MVAVALREWLPDVIQGVEPWMSSADIEAGARWSSRVQDELAASNFGIICVTPENQTAPWLLFEAGAIAKSFDDALVVPYLIELTPAELYSGPLTQFQAKCASRQETLEIVRAINGSMRERALPPEKLERTFDRWWPDLERAITQLPLPRGVPTRRTAEDMLEELLIAVRELRRAGRDPLPSLAFEVVGDGSEGQTLHVRRPNRVANYMIKGDSDAIVNQVLERLQAFYPSKETPDQVSSQDDET